MLEKEEKQTDKGTNSGRGGGKKRGQRQIKEERPEITQEKKSHDLPLGRRSGIMPEGKEKTKSKQ